MRFSLSTHFDPRPLNQVLRGHKNHIHSETTRKVGSQNIMLLPSRKETRILPISLVFVGIFYRPYYFTNCLFPFSKLSVSHLLAKGVVFTPLSDFQVDTNYTESCVAWSSAHGHRRRLDKLFCTYSTRIFSAQVCLQQPLWTKRHSLYFHIKRPLRFYPASFLVFRC